jgi:hypothetical protein
MKVIIKPSTRKDKKLMSIFYDKENNKIKTVHFGQKGYSDYTIHKDDKRKERYLNRHKKNEKWNDYMTPGSLSRYILWNKKTLKESIKDYKKRFKLN